MSKFNHRWSIICQHHIIDSMTNNLSLINVLEVVTLSIDKKNNEIEDSILPITFELVSFWDNNLNELGDLDYKIEIISPDKEVIFDVKPNIKVDLSKLRMRTIVGVNGLKAKLLSGKYLFLIKQRLSVNGSYKKIAEIPLEVNIV